MKYSTASLQNLCLIKIIQHLECYPPELLACLPPTLRRPLLLHMPIVDLCQLENTCVSDGVDVQAVWKERMEKQLYKYLEFIHHPDNCDTQYGLKLRYVVKSIRSNPSFSEYRRGYLATIIHTIFESARPTGYYVAMDYNDYYEDDEENQFDTLDDVDLIKYGLLSHTDLTVDIVNYLVAAARIEAVCVIREPDDEEYEHLREIEFYNPIDEFQFLNNNRKIDRRTYTKVNELLLFVPPRYSKYLNEDNHYRLSEEDALTLLMEKCNYYPEEVSFVPGRFCGIRWSWEQEKVNVLVGRILNKTEKVTLDCHDSFDEELVEPLKIILSYPNPKLSSIALKELANDEAIIAVTSLLTQPNTPCQLECFSVHSNSNSKQISSGIANAIGKMVAFQTTMSSLKISSYGSHHWNSSTAPHFVSGIESFIRQPAFENLCVKLYFDDIPEDEFYKVIRVFLTSPSSHAQSVNLEVCSLSPVTNLDDISGKLDVPELSLEYKSLEVHIRSELHSRPWLLSLQPLKLKKLNYYNEQNLDPGLLLVANNPSLHVSNLRIGVVTFSTEAFQTLLQNKTLRELEIVVHAGSDVNLSDITSALIKQAEIGTLKALTIFRRRPLNPPTIPLSVSDIQQFGDTLYSLPQLNHFSFYIDFFGDPHSNVIVELVETLFDCWKRKSKGCRPVRFVLCFVYEHREQHLQGVSETIKEHIQDISSEMGMEIRY